MKKLLLLLAAGFAFSSAMAQENSSIMYHPGVQPMKAQAKLMDKAYHNTTLIDRNKSRSTQRTTATDTSYTYTSWFDYYNQNYVSGVQGYYFDVYPDSNVLDPGNVSATSNGYIFCHGLGMSFDPTDGGYYNGASGIGFPPIIQTTDSSTPYAIDTFLCLGKYYRNDPTASNVDSIIVDLIGVTNAAGSGTYLLKYNANVGYTSITTDSTPRVAVADYMPYNYGVHPGLANDSWDSITTVSQRYAFPLTAASINDTDANGFNEIFFPLTSPLWIPGGGKVQAYVHFKSQVNYPVGTLTSAANYFHLFAGDPAGTTVWPMQTPAIYSGVGAGYAGSYQTGLLSQNQNDYGFPGFGGHNLLFDPMSFFDPASPSGPFGFEVPWMAFSVEWGATITSSSSVNTVQNLTKVTAVPNPATSTVTVSFRLANSANVTVTLTDMLGQVVASENASGVGSGNATFSTASLANGVYIYSVNADGARSTGRIVVAH